MIGGLHLRQDFRRHDVEFSDETVDDRCRRVESLLIRISLYGKVS